MIWVLVGLALLLVGILVFWWLRRRNRHRLISFVALVREPVTFDPAVLANVAGKVWKADLGDGTAEGSDGFVVCADFFNTIMCRGQMTLINCFSRPYSDDVEKTAAGIGDMRIRSLFCQHQGWFSCDALGIDGKTSREEVLDNYRRLGRLFAELLDDNCLLIFLPDSGLAFPINEDTEMALRSPDPVRALQDTLTMPVIEVPGDDPLMVQAVEKARQGWPDFVAAFEAGAGENFSVKAPVSNAGNTEFIWITVTSIEGDRIYGELGNDPANLGSLKYGSKVSVALADLNDWGYLDATGNLIGGFTVEAVMKAARRGRQKKGNVDSGRKDG